MLYEMRIGTQGVWILVTRMAHNFVVFNSIE